MLKKKKKIKTNSSDVIEVQWGRRESEMGAKLIALLVPSSETKAL